MMRLVDLWKAPKAQLTTMKANQNVKRSPQKDPSDWTTGDEPVTGPQASCLKTLARKPRATLMKSLTNAQASQWIDELQKIT